MIEAAGPAAQRGGPDQQPRSSSRILVANDERPIRDIVKRVLGAEGHSVDTCADGEAALRHLAAGPYDLVVLDFKLPLKSGAEVIRELRAAGNLVPILLTTGRSPDQLGDHSKGAGRVQYLPKPFTLESLRAAILRATAL